MTGRAFEIREFCLQDGPGIRTTVFLKGCPLRCAWCHNPEGQSFDVEELRQADGTVTSCGVDWTPEALADELLKNADILMQSGGGITFSGGEPLAQPDFVLEVVRLVRRSAALPFAIETSGYAASADYRRVVEQMDFVYQDVKFPDLEGYRRWTGVDATRIFENLKWLKVSGVPFVLRMPVIPGVNDSEETRRTVAELCAGSTVEYLPYNPLAGAKYARLGRKYGLA